MLFLFLAADTLSLSVKSNQGCRKRMFSFFILVGISPSVCAMMVWLEDQTECTIDPTMASSCMHRVLSVCTEGHTAVSEGRLEPRQDSWAAMVKRRRKCATHKTTCVVQQLEKSLLPLIGSLPELCIFSAFICITFHLHYICISHSPWNRCICITFD